MLAARKLLNVAQRRLVASMAILCMATISDDSLSKIVKQNNLEKNSTIPYKKMSNQSYASSSIDP